MGQMELESESGDLVVSLESSSDLKWVQGSQAFPESRAKPFLPCYTLGVHFALAAAG